MALEPNYCFSNTHEDVQASSIHSSTTGNTMFNLNILKDKVQHVHSIAAMFFSQTETQSIASSSTSIIMENISALLQEITVIASNVMFTCQNISPRANYTNISNNQNDTLEFDHLAQSNTLFEWSSGGGIENGFGSVTCNEGNEYGGLEKQNQVQDLEDRHKETWLGSSTISYDIIEMDAADLLAPYTHYCQVCGKGFKRDANLRMHMRAHGDEYKSIAALANPISLNGNTSTKLARKYSCPQEGCRRNRKHAKFQPLKSMICMKNHYKRSHCPKMYACKRCHQKHFSVLSDLRTHEKHCGYLKWRCSCGTTFSRKDKLMGHVKLFIGHTPVLVETGSLIDSQ